MFSPNAFRTSTVTRARLLYEDGSEVVIHPSTDPADLNRYTRWFHAKVNDYETKACSDPGREDECFGWCNLLAHRHAHNASDSPLRKIRLFEATYYAVPPGVEPRSWYIEEMRLTPDHVPPHPPGPDEDRKWQTEPDFWEFDVVKRQGRYLKD